MTDGREARAWGAGRRVNRDVDPAVIARMLVVPDHVSVNSIVLPGYRTEDKPPRTQYTEEAVPGHSSLP